MTRDEFNQQMLRLVDTYPKGSFSEERALLIWREVSAFEAKWFERVVDRFVGECRQAPLMPEFRAAISAERERLWLCSKQQEANDVKRFMHTCFPSDDQRHIIQQIVKRIGGDMDDETYRNFLKHIDEAAKSGPIQMDCGKCEDTGLLWAKHRETKEDYIFKCPCRFGERDGRNYPVWTRVFEADYMLDAIEARLELSEGKA